MQTALCVPEGNMHRAAIARRGVILRGRRPRARTEPRCARTGRSPERPSLLLAAGRIGKAVCRKPVMNGPEKSDGLVVPAKSPNKAGLPAAEVMEGRSPAKGNMEEQIATRTQRRSIAPMRSTMSTKPSASLIKPKVGAECGSAARSDLCGGRPESRDEGSSLPRSLSRNELPVLLRNRVLSRAPPSWLLEFAR
jgi:hypothetical protein